MSGTPGQICPVAREAGLVVKELPQEALIYDLERHTAFCLNKEAALIWRLCDGRSSISDIARAASEEMGAAVDDEFVWMALGRLEKLHLLRERVPRPAGLAIPSRRDLLKTAGRAAVVALPLITAIVAPTAAQAASGTITQNACFNRRPNQPGGCGGFACSDATGNCKPFFFNFFCLCQ